jgi:hypothetical protein
MKPEEIRDDIPADVREALVEAEHYGLIQSGALLEIIRKRPATVILPRAEIPAPLTEVPESGEVWTVYIGPGAAHVTSIAGDIAAAAVGNGRAYATKEDAQRALDAMMARESVEKEPKADDLSSRIPWAYLDPRWQWAAMDENGSWFAYEDEPSERPDEWTGGGCKELPIPEGAPVHWTETKVRRPEGV